MKQNTTQLDRRSYLKTAGVATAGMVGLAGCSSDGSGGSDGGTDGGDGSGDDEQLYGTLSTAITDQPNDIGDFEELIVTLDGIWVKPAGDDEDEDEAEEETEADDEETPDDEADSTEETTETESEDDSETTESDEAVTEEQDEETEEADESDQEEEADEEDEEEDGSGRRYIEFEESQQADLVQLQGSETALIDETEVEAGEYQFLQLDVSDTNGVLAESGEEADVETPGNAPLKFNTSFEIRAEERTRFIADFAPHQTGQGKYIIRPVATGTKVLYGDEEYEPDEDDSESTDSGSTDAEDGAADQTETGGDGDAGSDGGDGGDGSASDGNETMTSPTATPSD